MQKFGAPFGKTIFVCTHKRPDGHPTPCCANRGGKQLREELRQKVRDAGKEMEVKVFASGCLGACGQGPAALRYPDGEYVLGITPEDLPSLFEELTDD